MPQVLHPPASHTDIYFGNWAVPKVGSADPETALTCTMRRSAPASPKSCRVTITQSKTQHQLNIKLNDVDICILVLVNWSAFLL